MANSRVYLKSEAGGTTVVFRDTSATSGNLLLPASGTVEQYTWINKIREISNEAEINGTELGDILWQ